MSRIFWILSFLVLIPIKGYSQYDVLEIPDPKKAGQDQYVSNPDGIIDAQTVDSLNLICESIYQTSKAEVAVVLVNDFVGEDDFEFALQLFNTWGIGERHKNNGLLLFIAKNRHAYRFITGYGMESILPDVSLKYIGEHQLVPKFKLGEYSSGLIQTMRVIQQVLSSPEARRTWQAQIDRESSFWLRNQDAFIAALASLALLIGISKWTNIQTANTLATLSHKKKKRTKKQKPDYYPFIMGICLLLFLSFLSIFVIAFSPIPARALYQWNYLPIYLGLVGWTAIFIKYTDTKKRIETWYKDEYNLLQALGRYHRGMFFPLLFTPFSWLSVFLFWQRKRKEKIRFVPPASSGTWERIDRDQLNKKSEFLDEGQIREEEIQSKNYEIWMDKEHTQKQLLAWPGRQQKSFTQCPQCGYQTLGRPMIITRISPTYKKQGTGEKIRRCYFCPHQELLGMVILPMKERSSSSGGGSSSSSGGSSSSSSGSWGGGSSGGGGAGGHW